MHGQISLLNENASLALQVETDRAALAKDVASGRSNRFLWTGFGFLVLIGVSACVFPPVAPYASAQPARPVPEFITIDAGLAFNPLLSVLQPLRGRATLTNLRPAARMSMSDESIEGEKEEVEQKSLNGLEYNPKPTNGQSNQVVAKKAPAGRSLDEVLEAIKKEDNEALWKPPPSKTSKKDREAESYKIMGELLLHR